MSVKAIRVCIAIVIATLVCWSGFSLLATMNKEAETKQNLHEIELAVRKYALADPAGRFPPSIEELLRDTEFELPTNPFTGLQMKEVPIGGTPTPGDFTYTVLEKPDGSIDLSNYLLVAYGRFSSNRFRGRDKPSYVGFRGEREIDMSRVVIQLSLPGSIIYPSPQTP